MELTHIDSSGKALMVDVSDKQPTKREAVAEGFVRMKPETLRLIIDGDAKKGDVLGVARVAGIMAAKHTPELIPLCHPLPLTSVEVDVEPLSPDRVRVLARASCVHITGVEMEAMTAASVAALTVYDMCKAVDRGMTIEGVRLIRKSGGKSGVFERPAPYVSKLNLMRSKEGGAKRISLADAGALNEAAASQVQTFCTKRFLPDIVTDGLEYSNLSVGEKLLVGDAEIEITDLGKECQDECELRDAGKLCSLKTNCAFGKVTKKGEIYPYCEITRIEE